MNINNWLCVYPAGGATRSSIQSSVDANRHISAVGIIHVDL